MKRSATLRAVLVIAWAVALALLVPLFFFNFGGQWLHRIADFWPLNYP
jgi:hypothetical protein